MKKGLVIAAIVGATIMVIAIVVGITSCSSKKTVSLHCDGENCENLVEFKVKKHENPDESWVVFCEDCAENVLAD